ncbi:MAG: hypothetical protein QM399_01665 [Bacillota bacterium]|nr:hypothetical protein [Bacillota bacterium]
MKQVLIFTSGEQNKRIAFGIALLERELEKAGYTIEQRVITEEFHDYRRYGGEKIYVGLKGRDPFIAWCEEQEVLLYHRPGFQKEGFYLASCPGRLTVVAGADDAGAVYGCQELAGRIGSEEGIPKNLAFYDAPEFKLRGPCLGLQKTRIEPPRLTYEYPITPGRFPWFYDQELWLKFLDRLVAYRCNVLYLWSGHPFSSLVKLKEYPEALEVSEAEFELNRAMFRWLTEECDRRGIWVVLKFYNIHIPHPFAVKHGLEQRQARIHPLVADYTAKSIVEFIKSFPNIGLMVCLGEALRGYHHKTEWFVKTIIPAVKEGMRQANIKEEPPIILRAHDCDPFAAIEGAEGLYTNLYTMWKYNGESLTTHYPRGNWQEQHLALSSMKSTHIINVHILANLEPFRYNAAGFIQKCVQASKYRLGGNGLHLYPLFYWDWPYAPDKAEPRLLQLDRDWMWYEAWFRYAWNPERDEKDEVLYWANRVSEHYSISPHAGRMLVEAMNSAGQIAPKILGRIGITEGNRQTFSLGMTLSQITNVNRYGPNRELWHSAARAGEQPDVYVSRELAAQPHVGETPYDLIAEVRSDAQTALTKCEQALSEIANPGDELERIKGDIEALYHLAEFYCCKLEAGMEILKYKYTMDENFRSDFTLLDKAEQLLAQSLEAYKRLTAITEGAYLYANSLQTRHRKIPFPDGEQYYHWAQCLPEYEQEYANFRHNTARLKKGDLPRFDSVSAAALPEASFKLLSEECQLYQVAKGEKLFSDGSQIIYDVIKPLEGLTGIRMDHTTARGKGCAVRIELAEDSQILIGYVKDRDPKWLQAPELETNAHADDRGCVKVRFKNAIKATDCPPIDIHALQYEKGIHELYLGTGSFLIVGVVPKSVDLDAFGGKHKNDGPETLDWLYSSLSRIGGGSE